jgi:hypothetical protein
VSFATILSRSCDNFDTTRRRTPDRARNGTKDMFFRDL